MLLLGAGSCDLRTPTRGDVLTGLSRCTFRECAATTKPRNAAGRLKALRREPPARLAPPPSGLHIYPTQMAPFVRRPLERESGWRATIILSGRSK